MKKIYLLFFFLVIACQNSNQTMPVNPKAPDVTEMILDPVTNAKPLGEDGVVKLDDVFAAAPATAFILKPDQVQTVKQQLDNSVVENLKVASLKLDALSPPEITLNVEGGSSQKVLLSREAIHADDFQILTRASNNVITPLDVPKSEIFSGQNAAGEKMLLVKRGDLVVGSFMDARQKTYELKPLSDFLASGTKNDFVLAEVKEEKQQSTGECPLDHAPEGMDFVTVGGGSTPPPSGGGSSSSSFLSSTMPQARVAIHTDSHFLQLKQGNVNQVIAEVEAIFFKNRTDLYRNIGLDLKLVAIFVDTTDPFAGTRDAANIVYGTANLWANNPVLNSISRNFVQFITGAIYSSPGLGGAATYGNICAQNGAGVLMGAPSTITMANPNATTLDMKTILMGHEMGHNLNAYHCDGAPNPADCKVMKTTAYPLNPLEMGNASIPTILSTITSAQPGCLGQGAGQTLTALPFADQIFASQTQLNFDRWQYASHVDVTAMPFQLGDAMIIRSIPTGGLQQPGFLTSQTIQGEPGAYNTNGYDQKFYSLIEAKQTYISQTYLEMQKTSVGGLSGTTTHTLNFNPVFSGWWELLEDSGFNIIGDEKFSVRLENVNPAGTASSDIGVRRIELIQPKYVLNDWSQGGSFASGMATAGDFDNDGRDDIIIGSPSDNGRGKIQIFSGATGAVLATRISTHATGNFGSAVATAGDINSDGFADFLVGDPANSEVSVFLGGPTAPNAAYMVVNGQPGENFGWSIKGDLRFDFDTYPEFIVGAPQGFNAAGNEQPGYVAAYTTSPAGNQMWKRVGVANGDYFGWSVDGRTINGFTEFVVAGTGPLVGRPGYVKRLAYNGYVSFTFQSTQNNDRFGWAVAILENFRGPTYPIIAIGVPSQGTGRVKLYSSSTNNFIQDLTAGSSVIGYGCSLAFLDNFDHQRYSDLAIGSESGIAKIVFSMNNGIYNDYIIYPTYAQGSNPSLNAHHGKLVAFAGDVNGDGYPDLLMGGSDPATQSGVAKIQTYWGKSFGTAETVGRGGKNSANFTNVTYHRPTLSAVGFFTEQSDNYLRISDAFPSVSAFDQSTIYLNFGYNITRDPGLQRVFGASTMVIPEATISGIVDNNGNLSIRMPIGVNLPGPFYVQAFHFFPIYTPIAIEYGLVTSNVIKIEPRN